MKCASPVFRMSIVVSVLSAYCFADRWESFAVFPTSDSYYSDQKFPDVSQMYDVDGNPLHKIVWQQSVKYGGGGFENPWHWDIYGADLYYDFDAGQLVTSPFEIAAYELNDTADRLADQMKPSIWQNKVAWQDNYWQTDDFENFDIYVLDMTNPENPVELWVTPYLTNNQTDPAISGNIVVWQDESIIEQDDGQGGTTQVIDWEIYGADVTDPNYADEFAIMLYDGDQSQPAIFRNRVLWQDNYYLDWDISSADVWQRNRPVEHFVSYQEIIHEDSVAIWENIAAWRQADSSDSNIYGADVSDPANPVKFPICTADGVQRNPDVGDNLVVWQDYRNNNWDIYGYNLTTGQEFQITDDPADQTNPAVAGNVVVWQDLRDGEWRIYAAELFGPEVARCEAKPLGDANGDCMVNLKDIAAVAAGWLSCELDQPGACPF